MRNSLANTLKDVVVEHAQGQESRLATLDEKMTKLQNETKDALDAMRDDLKKLASASSSAASTCPSLASAPPPARAAQPVWPAPTHLPKPQLDSMARADPCKLEVKGWCYNSPSSVMVAQWKEVVRKMPDYIEGRDQVLRVTAPYQYCHRLDLTFASAEAARQYLAQVREWSAQFPLAMTDGRGRRLYITTSKTAYQRRQNGETWKTYSALLEAIGDLHGVTAVWGRHVVVARDGELELGRMDHVTMKHKINYELLVREFGEPVAEKVKDLIHLSDNLNRK